MDLDEQFIQECLAAHNDIRIQHKVPILELNQQMCVESQIWANHLAEIGRLEAQRNSKYGENLFQVRLVTKPSIRLTGIDPVAEWYKEADNYQFYTEPDNLDACHFTQMVWKETTEIGVGKAEGRNHAFYVVVNYSPKGNIYGSYYKNVPPSGGFPTPLPYQPSDTLPLNAMEFAEEGLRYHNEYRACHGCSPLSLSKHICTHAMDWAVTLSKADKFYHRPHNPFGENLHCYWSSNPKRIVTAKDVCIGWYSQIKNYVFGKEPNPENVEVGSFTQMVWKGSLELGMGIARADSGKFYVVANYNPRGNCIGKFAENVLRPSTAIPAHLQFEGMPEIYKRNSSRKRSL